MPNISHNSSGIAEGEEFHHYLSIELQMFNYFRQPHSNVSALLLAIPCYRKFFLSF